MNGVSNLYNDLRQNIRSYDYIENASRNTYEWTSCCNDWTIETELSLVTTYGVSNYVQKRLEDSTLTLSELELTKLRITSELQWFPSDASTPSRQDIVNSNMYMTIMNQETGQVTFSQIHGVGSNTGVINQTSLEIGKFWRLLCDENTFSIQKRTPDDASYQTKHIFS